ERQGCGGEAAHHDRNEREQPRAAEPGEEEQPGALNSCPVEADDEAERKNERDRAADAPNETLGLGRLQDAAQRRTAIDHRAVARCCKTVIDPITANATRT